MDNLDILPEPGDGQPVDGQAETPAQKPEGASQPPDVETRLSQIERDYKELQRDYTRKAQQLADLRRGAQVSQGSPVNQPVTEDFDWSNPGTSIRKAVRGELTEFQKQQEAERRAQRLITDTAEQYGIPEKKLYSYYQKLQEAAGDEYTLMDTVARMYRADHTDEAIAEAKRATQESVERNARGVTSTSGATQPMAPGKHHKDMNDKELDEYVMRTFGKAEWPS
jgi:hypothetical protein